MALGEVFEVGMLEAERLVRTGVARVHVRMIATAAQSYGGRQLRVGDEFVAERFIDIVLLPILRRATPAAAGALKPPARPRRGVAVHQF